MAHEVGPEDEPWRAVVRSERVERLKTDVAREGAATAERFWASLESAPLWEDDPDHPGAWRATFLWRGDPKLTLHATVCGPVLFSEQHVGQPMEHIDGTDVWHLTLRLPPQTRAAYALSPNGWSGPAVHPSEVSRLEATWVRDPLNDKTFVIPANEATPRFTPRVLSLLEAPDAPPQRWVQEGPEPRGAVELHELHSAMLGNTRRVWTYAPAVDRMPDDAPLIVAFDGWRAVHVTKLPVVLDNLIAAKELPPCHALLVDSGTLEMRMHELDCHEPYVAFLTDELLPWAKARWSSSPRRDTTLVAGVSLGGRAAVFAGLNRPDVFGKVIAQSTAVATHGAFTPLTVEPNLTPMAFYLDVGLLETDARGEKSFLTGNRKLRQKLQAAGHEVHYAELPCGHDEVTFCESIADGLRLLLGRAPGASRPSPQ